MTAPVHDSSRALRLGIVGRPFSGTLCSRAIAELSRRAGIPADFQEVPLDPAGLEGFLVRARREGWSGFGVASPLKEAVVGRLDSFDEDSAALLAVSVVRREGELWKGFNLDTEGFRLALASVGVALHGRRMAVWGCGGAARAACLAAARAGAASTTVFVRDVSRAKTLLEGVLARVPGTRLRVLRIGDAPPEDADLWVNATPVGMPGVPVSSDLWDLPANPKGTACDFVLGEGETPFLAYARSAGLAVVPASLAVVGQALRAWELWTRRPLRDLETQTREIAALIGAV